MHPDQDQWKQLRQVLEGIRPMDEQTMAFLETLAKRLNSLKAGYPCLEGVSFSPDVEGLISRSNHVHACR